MAAVYDIDSAEELCAGLQGSNDCDAAIQAAWRMADRLGRDVLLDDDDGQWIVHPRPRGAERREPADPYGGE